MANIQVTDAGANTINLATDSGDGSSGSPFVGKAAAGIGAANDAIVSAGAAGTVSAKLRRLTQGVEDLKTGIVLAAGTAVVGHFIVDSGVITTVSTVTSVTNVAAIGTSVTPGTGAAHLGKAEDAAHTSGDTGVLSLAVRRDANTSLVDATGDYAPLQVDATGSLKVAIISGAGSGGTAMVDDAAFTVATTSFTPVGGTYKSTLDTVDDGDGGAAHMTQYRALHVNLRDNSGNELSVGGGTQYDEDTASASAEKLTMAGVVRADSAASLVNADGDRTELIVDASGRLWVSANGNAAAGAADSGNPVKVGGKYSASLPTLTDGQRGNLQLSVNGELLVRINSSTDSLGQATMANSAPVAIASDQAAVPVKVTPATAGGWDCYRNLNLGTTGQVAKASAGQVGGWYLSNNASGVRYVKLYEKSTAPTSGDTPRLTLQLPAYAAANITPGACGINFASGIAARATTGVADLDAGAPAANDVILNLFFV